MLSKGERSGCFVQSYKKSWKSNKTDCSLTVTPPPNGGLMLCVLFAEFPDGCQSNVSLLFKSNNEVTTFCEHISRHNVTSPSSRNCFKFQSSEITLSYQAASEPPYFRLVISAYRSGPCSFSEFNCADGNTCIWPGYICDGFSNCMDNSDEDTKSYSQCHFKSKWGWVMFLGVLPIVIFSVCCIFVYIFYRAERRLIHVDRQVVSLCDTFPCGGSQANSETAADTMPHSWFCQRCYRRYHP